MVGTASVLGVGAAWGIRPLIQRKREEQATRTAEFYGDVVQTVMTLLIEQ